MRHAPASKAVALAPARGPGRAVWFTITGLAALTIGLSTLLLQIKLPSSVSYQPYEAPGSSKSERLEVPAQGWEAAEVDVYPVDVYGVRSYAMPVRTIPYIRTTPDRDSWTLWPEALEEPTPDMDIPSTPDISPPIEEESPRPWVKGIPEDLPETGAEAAPDLQDEFKLREAAARLGEAGVYLWDVYRRVPTKRDSSGDFTWKDPTAAKRIGMSLPEYVIGGIDPKFRERLFQAGRAMDEAGIRWSILSAFRDDYRQHLASGFKAGDSNSLHGGTRRTGGYGHGRAADIMSADGDHDAVWKWIDANGAKYGISRPMPGYDPAHIQAASDGVKFARWKKGKGKAKKRGGKKTRLASR